MIHIGIVRSFMQIKGHPLLLSLDEELADLSLSFVIFPYSKKLAKKFFPVNNTDFKA